MARQIKLIKAVAHCFSRFGPILFQPFLPYKSQEPNVPLSEETRDPTDEQLAQCQALFDSCEARCAHVEKKAQWTFTAYPFLIPALASVLVLLIRDTAFEAANYPLSLVFLSISTCLLILSFISALRAIAIHPRQSLYIGAVINEENGTFLEYNKTRHAQGLLYCTIMNTSINDHIAQLVKGAHILLSFSVIFFTSGMIVTGYQMAARMAPPTKSEMTTVPRMTPRPEVERMDGTHAAESRSSGLVESRCLQGDPQRQGA